MESYLVALMTSWRSGWRDSLRLPGMAADALGEETSCEEERGCLLGLRLRALW